MEIAGVMITNGGAHPAWKWARQTASQIVQIGESAEGALLKEAVALRDRVTAALEERHGAVKDREENHVRSKGDARLSADAEIDADVAEAVEAVVAAAKGTTFESHFAQDHVRAYLRDLIGSHMATIVHIERSLFVDANPAGPNAMAFRRLHQPGT